MNQLRKKVFLVFLFVVIGQSPKIYAIDWAITQRVGVQVGIDMAMSMILNEKGGSGFYHYGFPPRLSGNLFYDFGVYGDHIYLPTFLSIGINANMNLFAKATAIDNNQEVVLRWHEWGGDMMLKVHIFSYFHLGVGVGVQQQQIRTLPTLHNGFQPRQSAHMTLTIQSGFMLPVGNIVENRWASPLAVLFTLRGVFYPTASKEIITSKVKIGILMGLSWTFGEW